MDLVGERVHFNTHVAPKIAKLVRRAAVVDKGRASTRFAYFKTDDEFIVVAGAQEEKDCDLALAYGMTLRKSRRLVLVLPAAFAFATQQRLPFFAAKDRPSLRTHDVPRGAVDADVIHLSTIRVKIADAEAALRAKLGATSPEEELYTASAAAHLGHRSPRVEALVNWATGHPHLDPGHRRGERSWHCMGQRVLSIRGASGSRLEVRAGIHHSAGENKIEPHVIVGDAPMSEARLVLIKTAVEEAVTKRLHGDFCKPDEHWLQAVIRRQPELVGVEQPALREVPAWRPSGAAATWGRGYIDLLGIDGQGDLRIVETKLAANVDELLVLQGLDYAVWANVYRDALRKRLGIPSRAEFVVHYVIGATPGGTDRHVSPYAAAQAKAFTIPWRFQVVHEWFNPPQDGTASARSDLLPVGKLP